MNVQVHVWCGGVCINLYMHAYRGWKESMQPSASQFFFYTVSDYSGTHNQVRLQPVLYKVFLSLLPEPDSMHCHD